MKFVKENFEFYGGYLTYNREFVARFKRTITDRGSFQRFLIKNFTVEEYFGRLKEEAPLTILESKGYISTKAKKQCREAGFPETLQGWKDMVKFQWEEYDKKRAEQERIDREMKAHFGVA